MANPLATILSVAMMLRYSLDCAAGADAIEAAVGRVLDAGLRTADIALPGQEIVSARGPWADAVLGQLAAAVARDREGAA
jgi:3-isopropylmalate dehydrogenase